MHKSRNRDFSNTRLSYSRRQATSPSLSPSRMTNNNTRYDNNHPKQSKLCVNCYNHQLSVDKHTRHLTQDDEPGQSLTLSKLSNNERNRDLYKNQAIKMNEFNLKKIQENQRKKLEEKQKARDQNPSQQQIDHIRQLEERRLLEQKRRNQLREDLEKQITFAKQRRQQEVEQKKNSVSRPIISKENNQKDRQMMEDRYKQDLIKQINQRRARKLQQLDQSKIIDQENQLYFILNAENKRKNAQMQESIFKQLTRNELERRNEIDKAKKTMEAQKREDEAKNRQNQERQFREGLQQKQEQRREKIEKYICDLKKQMQENASKRSEEFKWITKPTDNCIIAPRKEPNLQPCSCCRKATPHQQLSPYVREIKKT